MAKHAKPPGGLPTSSIGAINPDRLMYEDQHIGTHRVEPAVSRSSDATDWRKLGFKKVWQEMPDGSRREFWELEKPDEVSPEAIADAWRSLREEAVARAHHNNEVDRRPEYTKLALNLALAHSPVLDEAMYNNATEETQKLYGLLKGIGDVALHNEVSRKYSTRS